MNRITSWNRTVAMALLSGGVAMAETNVPVLPKPSDNVVWATVLPDVVVSSKTPGVVWYHRNTHSSWRPVLNRSSEGKNLLMRGRTHAKGMGMRAPSNIRYPIKEDYDRFVALAGIDGHRRFGGVNPPTCDWRFPMNNTMTAISSRVILCGALASVAIARSG